MYLYSFFGGGMLKKRILFFLSFILFSSFFSCKNTTQEKPKPEETPADENSVEVRFFNSSSFKVDIFRNINPSSLDKTTRPITTVPAGAEVKLKLPPSAEQVIGDVFYIRYYVQIADSYSSGIGKPLYVQAKRDISNIAFVLEAGKSYTKEISQPEANQLKFINGYIKVQNTGIKSFQVMNGSNYLKKLGTEEPNLASGKFGFYEFEIPDIEDNFNVSTLKFFVTDDGKTLKAPDFVMERGKVYDFQCDGSQVAGPSTTDISY